MGTRGEPGAARWRRPGSRALKATLAASAGVLLTGGLAMAPVAHALAAGAAKTPERASTVRKGEALLAPGVVSPETASVSCATADQWTYAADFWGYCAGEAGPNSYRAVAFCANNETMVGWARWDGDVRSSLSNCAAANNDSTLSTVYPDWGFLLCTNNDGAGSFSGYVDESGDISQLLYNIGQLDEPTPGGITGGGDYLCDYDNSGEFA